jgi:hypothetical protein
MKKLYFLNEEESKRILNLHKEATKKQYLKEEILTEADMTDNDLLGSTNVFRSYIQLGSDFSILYGPLGINPANILGGRRVGVKGVVDALDGFVDSKDLAYVLEVINGLKGKCYVDDSKTPVVRISAMKRFLELYKEDEGEDLIDDVKSVGTVTLPTGSEKVKTQIINTIKSNLATVCSDAASVAAAAAAAGTISGATSGNTTNSGATSGNTTNVVNKGVVSNLQPKTKTIQSKLGVTQSGTMDQATIDALMVKLNGSGTTTQAAQASTSNTGTV